ncbi:HDOD domain-containing protein [Alteromonas sp. 1_MG-2023]|uniref:EAL and HDOD domain-containing protein n=1 Tax=Alteromonas sp. 1_MG-2023 TaxID=3062669 RepID=UPI0026E11D31|nr:HDOD domain-containing protein [Alteromonas sp. 1_MG-2023]MDO6566669.1 HDOD domain-containing protein [Alteromonas sp. 1_MG-2023]
MVKDVLTARQLVFNENHEVYACEFLCLDTGSGHAESPAHNNPLLGVMTTEVLTKVCNSVEEGGRHLNVPMFINVDQNFLSETDSITPIKPNIILEILASVEPTEANLKRIQQLRRLGFEFALSEYALDPTKTPFFKYLKIIKVDVVKLTEKQLEKSIPILKKSNCLLLAEKVTSQALYEQCKALGFDLFQGDYLEYPSLLESKKASAEQQSSLQLVSEFSKGDIEVDKVAEIISCDPVLTTKILHLINCPLYQLVRDVNSVREAVVILGLDVVKQWAIVMSLMSVSTSPNELFRTLLTRAKTLELIAHHKQKEQVQVLALECFLVGLLSGVDAIFEVKIDTLVGNMKIETHLKQALLTHDNELGTLLNNVIGIERFDSQTFERLSNQEICLIGRCQQDAALWADKVMANL